MHGMGSSTSDVGALLRELGLRSTPQRRAILRAFSSGSAEHLSADEVHARASQELPDLGRGTVYSTLAEFTEVGLLSAFGTSEPVRYETNTEPHDHFRCRLCLRLFDLDTLKAAEQSMPRGFTLERTETRAEGTCADCADYERGLRKGTTTIAATGALAQPLAQGIACVVTEGPLGPIVLAASDEGLLRIAFEGHGDADELRARAASRRGSRAARAHVERAASELQDFLHGRSSEIGCPVHWSGLPVPDGRALAATRAIPYGDHRSYSALGSERPAYDIGLTMGANPIPIAAPCHRVTRGIERPKVFVGGAERRRWLDAHERQHAA
jgi:Fe2+ or Zn2+ uptake regulation protein/O6-methylguanine-DNA--protein-cysteine methyltransferase